MGMGCRVHIRINDELAGLSDLMYFLAESDFRRGKRKLGVDEEWFECLGEGDRWEKEVHGGIQCS